MTACARCGDCCDPVVLKSSDYARLMERARREPIPGPNAVFIAGHWRVRDGYPGEAGTTWLRLDCTAFDPVSRLCTAHDGRP